MPERKGLEALLRAHGCTLAEQRRARIALLADEGWSTKEIALELGRLARALEDGAEPAPIVTLIEDAFEPTRRELERLLA